MGADLASWYDTITSVRDVQNHETLAYRQIWYETLLLAHSCLKVCNASGAVLGPDPAWYGFGPFWYPRGGFCPPPEQKRLAQSVAPRSGVGKRSAAALTTA